MYNELVILSDKVADLCLEIRRVSLDKSGVWADHIAKI